MRKIAISLLLLVTAIGAKAQFTEGTKYVSASISGLEMGYSDSEKFTFGVKGTVGYFFADSWMTYATAGYDHKDHYDFFNIGTGVRYYILQNGLYLGLGPSFEHSNPNHNNVFITPEIGYAFYLNHYVTLEPSVYYNMSLNDFSNGSKVGLRIGFGYYF